MRGDLLSGGTPKRLIQKDGAWSLEVVRQVAVDQSVYRPHSQLLDGSELILRYLKRNPNHSRLADRALQLLQNQNASQDRSFDAVNGDWVPSQVGPSHVAELQRKQRAVAQRSQYVQLVELRAEHLRLLNSHLSLRQRFDALLAVVEEHTAAIEQLKEQGPIVRQAPAAVAAPATAEVAKEEQGAAPVASDTALKLPQAADFIRCLEQLVGGDATAETATQDMELSADSRNLYVSTLVDDQEAVVGAVIMDLTATVYLGGTLLMVPEAELASQVNDRSPSEDSVAASSEVCNSLGGSINSLPNNLHIRSNFLEELDYAAFEWTANASKRITLKDSFGGQLMVVSR